MNLESSFESCLIVINRSSTEYKRSIKLAVEVSKFFSSRKIQKADITGLSAKDQNILLVSKISKLNQDSLICICGGDGTNNTVVNCLIYGRLPREAKKATLLPLYGGKENDLASMANGEYNNTSIKEIMRDANKIAIFPLSITLLTKDKRRTNYLAVCYASFGVTAKISKIIKSRELRRKRFYKIRLFRRLKERMLAYRHFIFGKPIQIFNGKKAIKLYDIVIINGPKIAKKPKFPLSIKDRKFIEVDIRKKTKGLKAYLSNSVDVNNNHPLHENKKFIINTPCYMQIDGETSHITKQTLVDIRLSSQCFYVFSTKL